MTVIAESVVPGLTQELYDSLIGQFEAKVREAPGFVAHVACEVPGGYKVTEIWDSPEQFNAWVSETVLPAALAVGMKPPIITVTPAHSLIKK